MTVLQTERLILSRLSYDDCEFIYELVNEPVFKRFVGDKQVATLTDAREYLKNGPIGSYERHGFGMFRVSVRDGGEPLGICGLVKREQFADPDLGFAFLRRSWAQGYALESAQVVLEYGKKQLGLSRIIAIADPDNSASVRLIEKLGLEFEGTVRIEGDTSDINLYATEAN
ncbi:MAG: ribosomal-protein-alanine N-acetyltransferase [Woeseiaceae bacterium]|jgi:ribosomal-protein-alanine N-acetyltransferase